MCHLNCLLAVENLLKRLHAVGKGHCSREFSLQKLILNNPSCPAFVHGRPYEIYQDRDSLGNSRGTTSTLQSLGGWFWVLERSE